MEDAFFSSAEMRAVKAPAFALPMCGLCGLYLKCKSPKMKVDGGGRLKTLIVGEAPGADEDDQGRPFVGKSGRKLEEALASFGVNMRRDCWMYNAVICRPPNNDLTSNKKAVDCCRPNLLRTVRELNPEKIILIGGVAVKSYIGHLWKEDPGGITRWAGNQIPNHKPNAWVCPTFHPSHVLRAERDKEGGLIDAMFTEHLRAAFELDGRPWPDGPPNYEERVSIILNPHEAAHAVRQYREGLTAFDFEFSPLKPDPEYADLVSCSVSDGKRTIAFPWHGAVRAAVCEMLEDPEVKKVGSNIKIEDRWCRAVLKTQVRGWAWDTMLAAHALDPRGGVTGLKFQAFVTLGQPAYNQAVEPFLKPEKEKGGNAMNRIRDVNLSILLKYNGLDSLLELLIARRQMKILGVKP